MEFEDLEAHRLAEDHQLNDRPSREHAQGSYETTRWPRARPSAGAGLPFLRGGEGCTKVLLQAEQVRWGVALLPDCVGVGVVLPDHVDHCCGGDRQRAWQRLKLYGLARGVGGR